MRRGKEVGIIQGKGIKQTSYYVKNKPQGYIVQHKEYNQDFVITIN